MQDGLTQSDLSGELDLFSLVREVSFPCGMRFAGDPRACDWLRSALCTFPLLDPQEFPSSIPQVWKINTDLAHETYDPNPLLSKIQTIPLGGGLGSRRLGKREVE